MITREFYSRCFFLKNKPGFANSLFSSEQSVYGIRFFLSPLLFLVIILSSGPFDSSAGICAQTQEPHSTVAPAESKPPQPFGVLPGKTTESELASLKPLGVPLKDYRDRDGYKYLLYQVKRYPVAITTLDGIVQTVDIYFPESAPLAVVVEAFALGDYSELSLPSAALVGVGIPDHWVPKHYADRGAVIYTSVAEGEESMQLLRFYKSAS